MTHTQPVYFVSHGNTSWIDAHEDSAVQFLRNLGSSVQAGVGFGAFAEFPIPKAILILSAYWETKSTIRVTTAAQHSLNFDGCRDLNNKVTYAVPGDPSLAATVIELVKSAGFAVEEESARGLDHGAFVPLMQMFPSCSIPVVAVSLLATKKPADLISLGTALKPLRSDGVLIIASGALIHNPKELAKATRLGVKVDAPVQPWAARFVKMVEDAVVPNGGEEPGRGDRVLDVYGNSNFKLAQPTWEHFAPLAVAVGAAGDEDSAELLFSRWSLGHISDDCFGFGMTRKQ
ncbi:Extradiol ring-cleavage dioxygenase, class III enzyme, subunit B [Zopfochytrium polystomum]|nr:Extradiol ring-cleavage dioxygenase, class III enzyme, subunit B [Zopfochytrium polystomum]